MKKIPRAAWAVVVLAVSLVTLFEAYPWLAIQEGAILYLQNPYSEMFAVLNQGYLPVTDLDCTCAMTAVLTDGTDFSGNEVTYARFGSYLAHGGSVTIPCFRALELTGVTVREGATLAITVSYALYHLNLHWLRRRQIFRFRSVRAQTGSQRWQYLS